MDEQETKGKEKEETTPGTEQGAAGDSEEGDKSKMPKVIVDANAAAKRLEKANEERAKLLGREEELVARKHLGGITEAGRPPEKKEETDAEYTKNVLAGKYND